MTEPPLTPERFAALQAHFEAALALPPEARDAHLDRVASDDPALAAHVRRLLVAHAHDGTTLGATRPGFAARWREASDPMVGQRLGAYRLERCIGEGGMGRVYEAQRIESGFVQRVAVKLLRQHAASEAMRQRFRDERQILATLQHPHIAVLLDGGVTDDDQPYFVMEYLDGEPITTWCDARRLSVARRLALFEQVCQAVQYAHQHLVVHRDLKPGNILVTSDGTVKLLDFGIAKLLRSDAEPDTVTQVGQRAYTPDYASPEQLLGLPIGTPSDVYALGVVLHELLTGTRPFVLAGKSAGEIERLVGEATPARPSSRIDAARAAALGERSATRAVAQVGGDLDAIILKAIRKEPARRYASVEELAADLRRFQDGRPVEARPEGMGYRFGKLVRRRKVESAAIALAVLFLIAGVVATARKTREAIQQRQRADQVKEFLATMLGAADPASFGKDVQVRTVLDSAAVRVDAMTGQPELEAEIREVIGGTYVALGEFELAEVQHRKGLAALQARFPAGHRSVAHGLVTLATVLEFEGRYPEADSLARLATATYARHGFPDELSRASHLDLRGRLLARLGDMAGAEPLFREALEIGLRVDPTNDSSHAQVLSNLGMVESELGRNALAESLFVAAVTAARRAHGDVHPLVASILSPLASVQERAGELERADSTFRLALAIREELLGPEHPDYAWTMFNFADHLLTMQQWAESATWSRRVLALRGRTLDDAHPAVGTAMSLLGRALDRMDSLEEGERWLRESWRIRREHLPEGHFLIASSESILGEHLVRAGRYPDAERHLLAGEAALLASRGESAPIIQDARRRLVALYEAWNRPAEAADWRSRLHD